MKFPVVGMQHRFPAPIVLSLIPPGSELYLEREPENPHDSNAIKVMVEDVTELLDEDSLNEVAAACEAQGVTLPDWAEPFQLGYIKALSINEEVVGAEVLAPRIDRLIESGEIDDASEITVQLVYGESGRPAVQLVDVEGSSEDAAIAEASDEDLAEVEAEDEPEDDEENDDLEDDQSDPLDEDLEPDHSENKEVPDDEASDRRGRSEAQQRADERGDTKSSQPPGEDFTKTEHE